MNHQFEATFGKKLNSYIQKSINAASNICSLIRNFKFDYDYESTMN